MKTAYQNWRKRRPIRLLLYVIIAQGSVNYPQRAGVWFAIAFALILAFMLICEVALTASGVHLRRLADSKKR